MLILALGCRPDPEPAAPIHLEPVDGNPLVPEVFAYPWPSDLYLTEDPASATGYRLDLPDDLGPDKLDPSVVSGDDGFSRVAPILTWLDGGVDPTSLPGVPGSLEDDSAVMLVRADTLAKVPVLAEVDALVGDLAHQALIVRPQITLDPAARYVVVLRDGLRTVDGGVHTPEAAFEALRDDVLTDDPVVEGMREDFGVVRDVIDGLGLDRQEVVLAWSFRTRSEDDVVHTALALQDVAASWSLGPWTLVTDTTDGAGRLITGTFEAPDFLGPDGRITTDAAGQPVQDGVRQVEFLLSVPFTVTEPRPVVVLGHGFFSAKEEITWSSFQDLSEQYALPAIAVDFIGFNEHDLASSAAALSGDLAELARVVDEQLQSQVHFTLLARLVEEQLAATVPELDATRIRYFGASNGGTQGAVIVATSPVLRDGVLVVPGGGWSHMVQRAVQWNDLGALFSLNYPDPLDLQLALSVCQQVFDPVDSLNFARGLGAEPFDGRTGGKVQLHMAVGDAQVANMVTEWLARSGQVPLVTPSPRDIWGLDPITLPGDPQRALFVYDEGYPPEVDDNVPPAEDNGAHETIRDLESYKQQVSAFLEDLTFIQAE